MKRLIGYISLAISFVAAVAVGVVPTILGINGGADYSSSKNFVFKISTKQTENDFSTGTQRELPSVPSDEEQPIDKVVKEFDYRLNAANFNDYKLQVIGDDILSLTLKDNNGAYDEVVKYLTFSNSLMIKDFNENYTKGYTALELASGSELKDNNFYVPGSAFVEYKNNRPYVVVKLSSPEEFKTMVNGLNDTETTDVTNDVVRPINRLDEEITDGSGEEGKEIVKLDCNKVLFVLNNWLSGFNLSDILNGNNGNINENNFSKYFLTYFDATEQASFYWDYDASLDATEQKAKAYEYVYFGNFAMGSINSSENSPVDVSVAYHLYNEVEKNPRLAYEKAQMFAAQFNGINYPYEVTLINQTDVEAGTNNVSPFVEYLKLAGIVEFSYLLIASLFALLIVSLFLFLRYGLSVLMSIISGVATVLGALALYNVLGNSFSVGTILGLIAVFALSIFTNTAWLDKAKKEIYEGKVLKKAYQEADKKSAMFFLDFNAIAIIIGLVCYLVPHSATIAFGAVLVMGAAINLVLSGIVTRGTNWFLFNSNLAQNHLNLFAVESKVAADPSHDVKSKFLESFRNDTDKSRKKFKVIGIFASVLFLASLIGSITFASVKGDLYNSPSNQQNTQLVVYDYINSPKDNYNFDKESLKIENVLKQVFTDQAMSKKAFSKISIESFGFKYKYGETEASQVSSQEVYFVVDLGKQYDLTSTAKEFYYLDATSTIQNGNISEALSNVFELNLNNFTIKLVEAYDVSNNSISLYSIIAASIALGVIVLYFTLRFGPSKSLTSLIILAGGLVTSIGVFSLIRIPTVNEITLGILLVLLIGALIFDTFFIGERNAYKERKRDFEDLNLRREEYVYQNNMSFSFATNTTLYVTFVLGSMLFSSSFSIYTLFLAIFGSLITLVYIGNLSLNLEMFFTKKFGNIRPKLQRPSKKNASQNKADEGPQEAIFAGIND
ncbi:MAG: hypothetical protein J6X03_01130 [Bacilli bacterium]|nr:hypothetical protein [Bacilli bacterium]